MKIRLIVFLILCVNFSGCFDDSRQYAAALGSIQPVEDKVWVCVSKSAKKYHKRKCHGFNRCTHKTEHIKKSDAKEKGYTECKICYKY